MALGIVVFDIMAFDIMALGIMAFDIMPFGRISPIQHNDTWLNDSR
jgi:hypothetical protein